MKDYGPPAASAPYRQAMAPHAADGGPPVYRPRIAHVYKDVYPPVQGGIERIIQRMALLCSDQFDVSVIVASRDRARHSRELAPGVGVLEVPCLGRALSAPLAPGFRGALRDSRADLFHFHVPHPTGELAYLASGLRTPAVATYHSDVVRQRRAMLVYRPIFQRFLSRMQVIMPTSRRYMETSMELAPHLNRCRVVALGYPLEAYAPTAEVVARAEALRAHHGEFVLFIGCLRAYKGLPFLLRAMCDLPGIPLMIIGEGPMAGELDRLSAELGIAERVIRAGGLPQNEAVAALHAAALLILPSHQRSEAFGLCQIEAMACGLPVISTNLPTGVPEVNQHGLTGLIVPPADSEALAGAIRELLADPGRRRAMGEAGIRRAHALYSERIMAQHVTDVYKVALGGSRVGRGYSSADES